MVEMGKVIEDYITPCNGNEPNLAKVITLVKPVIKDGFERFFRVSYHNMKLLDWSESGAPSISINLKGREISEYDVVKKVLGSSNRGMFRYLKDRPFIRARYTIYQIQEE